MKTFGRLSKFDRSTCKSLESMRTHIHYYEELIELRAGWLDPKDRALLEVVYLQGLSIKLLAAVTGIDESSLRRRIRILTRRLRSPEFLFCMRNQERFNKLEMSVAQHYFIERKSIPAVACQNETTIYRVRKILKRIRTLMERELSLAYRQVHS